MLVEAKSNLARLMATENLVVEERNVPTAYFDIKSRILTVPILNGNLSNYLYDLLLGHEVGHALETPETGWHDSVFDHKVNKDILNVCEDVRIEKKIKRKFPGLKYSFVRGYQELMDMDFFGVKDRDLNSLNFIDRVNLYTKGGTSQGIKFSDEESVLLREIESTETWEQVVAVAKKVQEFMKAELENAKKDKKKIKVQIASDDEEAEGSNIDIDPENVEFDDESVADEGKKAKVADIHDSEKDGSPASGENMKSEKENNSKKPEDSDGAASSGAAPDISKELESKTDKSFREKEKQLYNTSDKRENVYSDIPKINLENIIVGYDDILDRFEKYNRQQPFSQFYFPEKQRVSFLKFKNESNKVVSYLVKEFELRKNADQQSRAKVSKTGELNMSKIHEYRFNDDIFERMTKVPNGKSHGLVMFIDWSGSMTEHINNTVKQLLNLVMFCKKVNIPFEVYAFTSQWKYGTRQGQIQTAKVGELVVDNFHLLNIFSSKMKNKEFTLMAEKLLDYGTGYRQLASNMVVPEELSLGGTPLNSCIISAFELVPEFKEKNKLQIVNSVFLTDGESSKITSRFSFISARTNTFQTDYDVSPTLKKRIIFRDPKTKAIIEVEKGAGYGSDSAQQTKALLTLLKQRVDGNLIGFYIADTRSVRNALEIYVDPKLNFAEKAERINDMVTSFRKEKTMVIEDFGYDEYYFIRSADLNTDDDELVVNSSTVRGFVSAFSKYTEGKISSRLILNRFIRLIA